MFNMITSKLRKIKFTGKGANMTYTYENGIVLNIRVPIEHYLDAKYEVTSVFQIGFMKCCYKDRRLMDFYSQTTGIQIKAE